MSKCINELLTRAVNRAGNQTKLGLKMGIGPNVISDWKHERKAINPERIAELARLAGEDEGEWIARIAIEKTGNAKARSWLEKLTASPLAGQVLSVFVFALYIMSSKNRRSQLQLLAT